MGMGAQGVGMGLPSIPCLDVASVHRSAFGNVCSFKIRNGKGSLSPVILKKNKNCYKLISTCAQVCQELQGTTRASLALCETSDGSI